MRRLFIAALLFVLSATSAFADCKSDLAAVDAAFKAAGPYHMEMMLKQGSKTTRMSGDVVPPSSFPTLSVAGEDEIKNPPSPGPSALAWRAPRRVWRRRLTALRGCDAS